MDEKNIGWIKLDRRIAGWGWYKDANTFRVFMHLLLTANWEASEYQGFKVDRGSIVVGVNALSAQIGISVQATRTSLKKLEKTGEINKQSTNKFSIVSICNYETYQSKETTSNKPTTNEQQTSNKRATTSKEVKKERRAGDDDSFFLFGIDTRTISPTTKDGKKRTKEQIKHIAKLQSEGITIS